MTYCFFSAQYAPSIGGVESHTRYLAEKAVQKGDRAIVLTSARDGRPPKETSPAGVEVWRVPSIGWGGGRLPMVRKNKTTRRMLTELAGEGVDRVLIQTRLYTLSLLGVRFARQYRIPYLVIEHGFAYSTTGFPPADWALKIYVNALKRRVLDGKTPVYAVSQSSADWLEAHGTKVCGILHNCVSRDAVQAAHGASRRDFRGEAGCAPESLVLCYAGRMIPEKGVGALAGAVTAWNRRHPETPLYFLAAGQGPLEKELGNQKEARICPLGPLGFEEVIALLEQSDVFCLPTGVDEGLPSSILEAGACGCFVMATGRGGVTEILPTGDYGAVLPDNHPETLLSALEEWLPNPAGREKAALALRWRVEQEFTYDTLYEQLTQLHWEAPV